MNTPSISEPTKEPAVVSDSLPTSLASLVNDHPDWENSPKAQVNCPHCGNTHWHNQSLASVFKETPCDPCADAYSTRLGGNPYDDPIQTTQSILDALLPPSFRDTDPSLLDQDTLSRTLAWKPNNQGIGLYLVGPSRSGKTRTICLLAKQLVEEHNLTPRIYFPGQFHVDLLENIRSERNYRIWRNSTHNAPILILDDLFAETLTPRIESAYFELIDSRMNQRLPTFITTQFIASDAAKLFSSPHRGLAFLARLKESTSVIPFGDALQSKLTI